MCWTPAQIDAAEKSSLGIQLKQPELIGAPWLPSPTHYVVAGHEEIARALHACGAGATVDDVCEALTDAGQLEACGGRAYLDSLLETPRGDKTIRRNAGRVIEAAQDRAAADVDRLRAQLAAAEALAHTAPAQQEWVAKLREWSAPADLPSADEPVEMEVEGLIPARKVGALVAAGGTGKTMLQITMYVCGATGRPFLGRSVRAGTYALLSSDDSQEDLDRALARVVEAMQLSPEELDQVKRRVRLHSLQGLGGGKTFATMINGSAVATGLEFLVVEALRQVTDLRILGLDTLRQFSGGTTNDEQIVKLSISGAEEIARQLGCAVVMAHHTGKSNYRDGITDMYCGSGSAAIADNCRFVMLLQSTTWPDVEAKVKRTGVEKGDPLVLQSTRGSLLVKAAPPIFLHRDGFYLGAIAGASLTLDQVLDERDRKVLAAVRSGAGSKNAIFSMVKGKKTFVMAAIDELEARGHIVNSSPTGSQTRPNFTLAASGAKILEISE